MNVKRLPSMLEITFWNFAIAVLTQSALAKVLFRWAFPHVERLGHAIKRGKALAVASIGLSAGLAIALLVSLVVF